MTVKSELGEPIHKIATRGVLLWKELDETIFSLPRDKRKAALLAKRDYYIQRLNADHQKVWFGRKRDGSVCDLESMTYAEVMERFLQLTHVHGKRWIDHTYQAILHLFMVRVEERMVKESAPSQVPNSLNHDPQEQLAQFIANYPDCTIQTINAEDVDYFLLICQNPVNKPVPFVPVLDENFEYWFKRDSLWQSEDVEAIAEKDPQRACILHGPVAAFHSKKVDEPVADILNGIHDYHLAQLKDREASPVEWFGTHSATGDADWESVDGEQNWLHALLHSQSILQGRKFVPNTLARIFKSRQNASVKVTANAIQLVSQHDNVLASASIAGSIITVQIPNDEQELLLKFQYSPTTPRSLLIEIMEVKDHVVTSRIEMSA